MFGYKAHRTYDRADKDLLKKQYDDAYEAGLNGFEKVEANEAAKTKAQANVTALERTLAMFPDLRSNHGLTKLTMEKLGQEQKWLNHYEKCIENTKRGYSRIVNSSRPLVDKAYNKGAEEREKIIRLELDAQRAAQAHTSRQKQREQQRNGNNNKKQDQPETFVVKKMVLKGSGKDKPEKMKKIEVRLVQPSNKQHH